jgi:micrococcal nuclease
MEEYEAVRRSTIALSNGLPDDALTKTGIAYNLVASVMGLLYHLAGMSCINLTWSKRDACNQRHLTKDAISKRGKELGEIHLWRLPFAYFYFMKQMLIASLLFLTFCFDSQAQTKIAAKDAAKHIGDSVTICDKVYGTYVVESTNMVLLNIGADHPDQLLTAVIPPEVRSKFPDKPEEYYKGKEICVTGKLIDYKGKPEIILASPNDLKVSLSDNTVNPQMKSGN